MASLARVVVPDIPHHFTQRGNRRQQAFFSDDDCAANRDQLNAAPRIPFPFDSLGSNSIGLGKSGCHQQRVHKKPNQGRRL